MGEELVAGRSDATQETQDPHAAATARIDLATYLPHHLTVIANRWARGSSRIYLKRFGIGVNEWRVLSTLAIEPGCTANRICQMTTVDKGIISRAVKTLQGLDLLAAKPDPEDPRKIRLMLTPEGARRHEEVMGVALERQQRLFSGLTSDEIAVLTRMVLRMRRNLDEVNAPEFMQG